jgi:isoaspartyl peptidase/L-asparaginase-like protein (Ntn-hydrolase superfamily)
LEEGGRCTAVIAIHGGAGVLRADRLGQRHRAVLQQALQAG